MTVKAFYDWAKNLGVEEYEVFISTEDGKREISLVLQKEDKHELLI